ncbi:SAM-dependent methyltransferase [Thermostichus sp. MS-CIW-21]|uniref:glycosyltransferase n=1 Tax=unclassified Synechococcus TaxID=2626047 RepID=UPI000C17AF87|nr:MULTISPECIES: glycosyltransferase [unclassified Synechococcus]PIK84604.1 glycosyl transferase [Synechococcus sp. 65AY6A5]PIK95568.1 glycosyl transferase [Synechococcus sp. 60AY4M2]PIL01465.1 glycosyl transferase [Synechococcus sp. 65AY640]
MTHPLHYWRQKNRYYHEDLERLHRFFVPPGLRILEIGSGTGSLLNALQPSFGVGIDWDAEIVAQAQRQFPHLHFRVQDAHTLDKQDPILAEPFDVILLVNTLGYLADVQQVLERLRRFCTPRTRLILSYHNPLWEPLLSLATVLKQRMPLPAANWLSAGDVANLLHLAGYEVIQQGKRLLLPRRIPLLSTLINRFIAPLPGINALCLTEYTIARPQPDPAWDPPLEEQPSCTVVIPARNEAGNIRRCVQQLPEMGSRTEIIFVEGHSSDDTWAEIQRVQDEYQGIRTIQALRQEGKGKGDAVRKGFAAASGDVLIILDADLTVQAEELPKFFRAVASGRCDFANGCRLVYPLKPEAMPRLNQWANRFFAALLSHILGIRIKDSLCGTKALWREDYWQIAKLRQEWGDFDPFGDFDLLLGAAKRTLKILDIPVRYFPRTYGRSNIQHVRDGLRLLQICAFALSRFKGS